MATKQWKSPPPMQIDPSKSYAATMHTDQGDMCQVDLNASITFNDHWTLRAYARNLLDNKGEMARSTLADGLNRPSFLAISPLQPRTIGVALDMAF